MTMEQRKKVTIVTRSCVNCPRSDWNDLHRTLYCRELKRYIEPNKEGLMAIYFNNIPKECPFPDTKEEITW
jgi:hypothetical protein